MKSTEFYALAEQFAPKSLSDEFCRRYGAYDNSGLLLDSGEDAEKILFSLDLSLAAIERAKREGAGIICTHHPRRSRHVHRLFVLGEHGRVYRHLPGPRHADLDGAGHVRPAADPAAGRFSG